MKDYIFFAIRVNIALVLATMLFTILVIPLLFAIIGALSKGFTLGAGDIASVTEITTFIVFALLSFKAAHWVFRSTYKNMRLKKHHLEIWKCILYSFVLHILIIFAFYYADPEVGSIAATAVSTIAILLGFYLAGKSVDENKGHTVSSV